MYRVGDVAPAPGAGAVDLPGDRGRPRRRADAGASTRAACSRSPRSRCSFLYAFLRLQDHLWLSLGFPAVAPDQALEHRGQLRHQHQLAVVLAASRPWATSSRWPAWPCRTSSRPPSASRSRSRWSAGSPAARTEQLGNFWVDLVRICLRVLLPVAVVGADRLRRRRHGAEPVRRHRRHHPRRRRPSTSPAARSPARRSSRSSAPTAAASTTPTARTRSRTRRRGRTGCEIFLLLVIPFSLPRVFGRMVGDNRQGYAIVAVMATLAVLASSRVNVLQVAARRHRAAGRRRGDGGHREPVRRPAVGDLRRRDHADLDRSRRLVPRLVHRARRHGRDVEHDARRGRARRHRLGPVRHARPRGHHGVRRRADGRPDAGVPRQEDRRPGDQVRVAVLPDDADRSSWSAPRSAMALPSAAGRRCSTPARTASPRCSTPSRRPATTTARRSPGIGVNTTWYNTALGLAMLFGPVPADRLRPRAGRVARPAAAGAGDRRARCRTYQPLFVGMLAGVTVIVVALTFLPALALGPLAEGLQ